MSRRREQAISMPLLLFSAVSYQPECFLQPEPGAERADEPILPLISQGRSRWAVEANPIHPTPKELWFKQRHMIHALSVLL